MKLLVTGCSGFLGGVVAACAAGRGHEVVGATLGPTAQSFRAYDLDLRTHGIETILAEERPDVIFHAAGSASVGDSVTEPFVDFGRAVITWARVLEAARTAAYRPVVMFPSSAAVYGNPAELPVREDAPLAPISPYGVHKRMCEMLAEEYARFFQLDLVVGRIFSVVGPSQRRLLVWELWSQLARKGDALVLDGTGEETRDFLDERDLGACIVSLLERAHASRKGGSLETVNLASGAEVRVRDIAESLAAGSPGKSVVCRGNSRPGDPKRWRADVARVRELLPAWSPRPFAEAMGACVSEWGRPGVR